MKSSQKTKVLTTAQQTTVIIVYGIVCIESDFLAMLFLIHISKSISEIENKVSNCLEIKSSIQAQSPMRNMPPQQSATG